MPGRGEQENSFELAIRTLKYMMITCAERHAKYSRYQTPLPNHVSFAKRHANTIRGAFSPTQMPSRAQALPSLERTSSNFYIYTHVFTYLAVSALRFLFFMDCFQLSPLTPRRAPTWFPPLAFYDDDSRQDEHIAVASILLQLAAFASHTGLAGSIVC